MLILIAVLALIAALVVKAEAAPVCTSSTASSSSVTVGRAELEALRLEAREVRHLRIDLAAAHADVEDLETTHRADLLAIESLTATTTPGSALLDACALGGAVAGALGGACAGASEDARTACTVGGVIGAAAATVCGLARMLTAP